MQMTISGDIVAGYQGYAPQVSDNISIPASFFTTNFILEQQQLTFNFVGGVPTFTAANNKFALMVGTTTTAAITFSTSATTTASAIQAALVAAGFTGTTVTGSLSGSIYTFKVILGPGATQPAIVYVGALPGSVTFANSVAAPAAAQQLTFSAATVPVNGLFELQSGTRTTAPINFDSTNPASTAANIQAALRAVGFGGTLVTVDAASTATSFIFDVTFTAAQAAISFVAAPVLPSTLSYAAAVTVQGKNTDLLPYFNALSGSISSPLVGNNSPSAFSLLYLDLVGSTLGNPTSFDNYTVTTSVNKVLFEAEYNPPPGTPAATQTQLSRLTALLEGTAGLLRGDANGIMTSQWDANTTDSKNSTYSDNIVSTQRDGENQRYYLVVPYDVQQGQLILQLSVGPVVESPNDVVPPAATTVFTPVITMPSSQPAEPGAD